MCSVKMQEARGGLLQSPAHAGVYAHGVLGGGGVTVRHGGVHGGVTVARLRRGEGAMDVAWSEAFRGLLVAAGYDGGPRALSLSLLIPLSLS